MVVAHFGRVSTGMVKKAVKALVRERKVLREKPRAHARLEPYETIRIAATGREVVSDVGDCASDADA